jgi:hypothetical protein
MRARAEAPAWPRRIEWLLADGQTRYAHCYSLTAEAAARGGGTRPARPGPVLTWRWRSPTTARTPTSRPSSWTGAGTRAEDCAGKEIRRIVVAGGPRPRPPPGLPRAGGSASLRFRTRRRRGRATTATSCAGATCRPSGSGVGSLRARRFSRARGSWCPASAPDGSRHLRRGERRPARHRPAAGEVVLTAHLCHQSAGANDNASGSAAILEVGRALQAAVARMPAVISRRKRVRFSNEPPYLPGRWTALSSSWPR